MRGAGAVASFVAAVAAAAVAAVIVSLIGMKFIGPRQPAEAAAK
jgi:hypothetical protein